MKRKLIRQLLNEWRSNIWLALELLIVSVVMWFITDDLYTSISILNEPLGFNTEHCYKIDFQELNEKSPEYIKDLDNKQRNAYIHQLLDRLEHRPEIEAVALGINAYFYNISNNGTYLSCDSINSGDRYLIYRDVSPDFVRVFRIHGSKGETPEQLAEILRNDRKAMLVSENAFRHQGLEKASELIGHKFYNGNGGDSLTLRATYVPTRYNDYQSTDEAVSVIRARRPDRYHQMYELVVRVKANMDKDFMEKLMDDADSSLRLGNYYIAAVQSFDNIREVHQRTSRSELINYFTGAAFLALNIFLGLLGTFWFRTQQRVSEIAVRKISGATRGNIFRRMVGEGELLLLLIMPVAVIIDWGLAHYELNTYYQGAYLEPIRFINCVLISWGLMALMIALGIIIPANRAMNIAPAKALSTE